MNNIKKVPLSFFYNKKDDWDHNYNNQDFFQYNVERLRYLLVTLEPQKEYMIGNPFYNCVDMDTLEVKNVEFYKLALSTLGDLKEMVYEKNWEWLGDDFDHMESYLSWIAEHDKDFVYNVCPKNDDEYLEINTWALPKKYSESKLRDAYLAGISAVEGVVA
jgi:hypothetical protein|tara:strand:- start:131 stop:613 length:483 start_codon:yes stop_codon:yes gene_type:complete